MKLRRNTTPKNDGLPIVHGKKVRRRHRFGLSNARSRLNNDNVSDSCFDKCLRWSVIIVICTIPLQLLQDFSNIRPFTAIVNFFAPNNESESSSTTAAVVSTASVETKKAETPIISSSTGGYGYPDKCTTNELAILEKQLPTDPLIFRPWRPASFTLATVRTDYAQNPNLMREFYASDKFKLGKNHQFYGVVLGWQNNDVPIDTLAIGSRDANIDTKKWVDKLKLNSKKALPPAAINSAAGTRPARVVVVEWGKNGTPINSFQELRDSVGDSADNLPAVSVPIHTSNLLDIVRNKMPEGAPIDQPIHYLHINNGAESLDAKILEGLTPILNQVRYAHFEYNKDGSWVTTKLSTLIGLLKNEGLVCYFAGSKETDYGFWRITDCFLDYYDHRHWAQISCVNVKHDDVKELAHGIETVFLKTLQKDHVFLVPPN